MNANVEPDGFTATSVAGSLSDDVLSVYEELRACVRFWQRNVVNDAVRTWHGSFASHCGEHAVDALCALHRACAGEGAIEGLPTVP